MLTVTLNGTTILADKTGGFDSRGTMVTFEDGSTVDVTTGKIENRGDGEIRITTSSGLPSVKSGTKGPFRFDGGQLTVSHLAAVIRIEPWEGPGMEVMLSGPSTALDFVSFKANADMLTIGGAANRSTTIAIRVSRGTALKFIHLSGPVSIGDIDGPLTLQAGTGSHTRCGRITAADIQLVGNPRVDITEANGPVCVKMVGAGHVMVHGGGVTVLKVQVDGDGRFECASRASAAKLALTGAGSITIKEPVFPATTQTVGTGKITIEPIAPSPDPAPSAPDVPSDG